MFNHLKKKCLLLLLSTSSLSAFAHAGHDHQSNWAFLMHALWLAPAIFAVYMVVKLLKTKKQNKQ